MTLGGRPRAGVAVLIVFEACHAWWSADVSGLVVKGIAKNDAIVSDDDLHSC